MIENIRRVIRDVPSALEAQVIADECGDYGLFVTRAQVVIRKNGLDFWAPSLHHNIDAHTFFLTWKELDDARKAVGAPRGPLYEGA